MAKITTGQSFNSGDQVTSTKLNNIIGTASLDSGSVTGTTLNLTNGQLKVATNGITGNELKSDASVDANRAVGTNHIKDSAITTSKLNDGSVTDAKLSLTGITAGTYNTPTITVNNQGRITGLTAASASNFYFQSTLQNLINQSNVTSNITATSIDISTYVSAATTALGSTPTVAILTLFATVSTSPTGTASNILKVGKDSSFTNYGVVEARNDGGSRNDGANTASPTSMVFVPIGGTANNETLHYKVDISGGYDRRVRIDLNGFAR